MKNSKHLLALPCLAVLPLALFSFKSPKISDSENALNKLNVVKMTNHVSTSGAGFFSTVITKTAGTSVIEAKVTSTALIELNDNSLDDVISKFD